MHDAPGQSLRQDVPLTREALSNTRLPRSRSRGRRPAMGRRGTNSSSNWHGGQHYDGHQNWYQPAHNHEASQRMSAKKWKWCYSCNAWKQGVHDCQNLEPSSRTDTANEAPAKSCCPTMETDEEGASPDPMWDPAEDADKLMMKLKSAQAMMAFLRSRPDAKDELEAQSAVIDNYQARVAQARPLCARLKGAMNRMTALIRRREGTQADLNDAEAKLTATRDAHHAVELQVAKATADYKTLRDAAATADQDQLDTPGAKIVQAIRANADPFRVRGELLDAMDRAAAEVANAPSQEQLPPVPTTPMVGPTPAAAAAAPQARPQQQQAAPMRAAAPMPSGPAPSASSAQGQAELIVLPGQRLLGDWLQRRAAAGDQPLYGAVAKEKKARGSLDAYFADGRAASKAKAKPRGPRPEGNAPDDL